MPVAGGEPAVWSRDPPPHLSACRWKRSQGSSRDGMDSPTWMGHHRSGPNRLEPLAVSNPGHRSGGCHDVIFVNQPRTGTHAAILTVADGLSNPSAGPNPPGRPD